MSEEIKNDFCQQSETGRKLFNTFVDERLETGKVNFWLTMRKMKLKTWPSSCKVIKMKAAVKVVELKEDRSLFAQLMMICKSRPEVDIKFKQLPSNSQWTQGLFLLLMVPCCTAYARVPLCIYWRSSRVSLAVR